MADPRPEGATLGGPRGDTTLRAVLGLGALCLGVGALGWAWALLARQAPASAWHVRGFPGEVERLALHAWVEGLAVFALAPRAWRAGLGRAPRRAYTVVLAGYVGTALALGALGVSARTGQLASQLAGQDGFNRAVLLAGAAGEAVLVLALGVAAHAAAALGGPGAAE